MSEPLLSYNFGVNELPQQVYTLKATQLAPRLIGCEIITEIDGELAGGKIVECEAYSQNDPASHSFNGQTARNGAMFGESGRLYVYLSYGIHYCLNIVCGSSGRAEAVLLRALEPTSGLEIMVARRGLDRLGLLCRGPGRLAQALGVNIVHNNTDINSTVRLLDRKAMPRVITTQRIGISKANDRLWRYVDADSKFLSGPKTPNLPVPGATK